MTDQSLRAARRVTSRPRPGASRRPGRTGRVGDRHARPRGAGAGGRGRPDPGRGRGADQRRRPGQARRAWSRATSTPSRRLDTHSQAFTDKVKDIGKLGDDDIRASAAVSNRLLDKPLAAMQNGGLTETSTVSKSLLSLRRQVEDLDPLEAGRPAQPAQAARPPAVRGRRQAPGLLRQVPLEPAPARRDHHRALPRPGRAPARQRLDRAGEGQPVGGHGPPAPVLLPRPEPRHGPDGADRRDRGDRSGAGQGPQGGHAVLRPPEEPGPADPARGERPGLPRPRRHPAQQPRAHQGRPAGHDHDGLRAADRRHRRPGAGRPEARPRPDHRPQHDDLATSSSRPPSCSTSSRARSTSRPPRRRSTWPSSRRRSPTSTPRWTRSTRSRSRRSTRCRRR